MSKITLCDIHNCKQNGALCRVAMSKLEIVPTGNSDYSAYEEQSVHLVDRDLCEEHWAEYQARIAVFVLQENNGKLDFPKVKYPDESK